jgi:hypothetical protein
MSRHLNRFLAVSFPALALLVGVSASAATMTLQFGSPADTYQGTLEAAEGNSASFQGWSVLAMGTPADNYSIALVKFADSGGTGIGTIPAGSKVNSAILRLTTYTVWGGGSNTLIAAPVTSPWIAGKNYPVGDPGWATFDVNAASPAATLPTTTYTALDIDVTSIVQSWVDGSRVNNGFALYSDAAYQGTQFIATNNGAYGSLAEKLTIDYAAAVPEPTTLGLVGLAGLALLSRRRKVEVPA